MDLLVKHNRLVLADALIWCLRCGWQRGRNARPQVRFQRLVVLDSFTDCFSEPFAVQGCSLQVRHGMDSLRRAGRSLSGFALPAPETCGESLISFCCGLLVVSSCLSARRRSGARVKGRFVEEILWNQIKPGPEYGDRVKVFVP